MATAVEHPHLEKSSDGIARLKRVPRIRVAQIVMDYQAHGWSPEEMCRQHPYLTIAEAYSAMAYYWDHPDEIDAEIRAEAGPRAGEPRLSYQSPFYRRMKDKGLL